MGKYGLNGELSEFTSMVLNQIISPLDGLALPFQLIRG
jgi:hypothetical protein